MTEECIERGVCTSIAKSIEPMVDPKDCQTQFKCGKIQNIIWLNISDISKASRRK